MVDMSGATAILRCPATSKISVSGYMEISRPPTWGYVSIRFVRHSRNPAEYASWRPTGPAPTTVMSYSLSALTMLKR